MVQYWKRGESVQAKVTKEDGAIVMKMAGEKYTFPGFPRGYLLFGKLSKLKHELKNQLFNEGWRMLENGSGWREIAFWASEEVMPRIYALMEDSRYDMVPRDGMIRAVREIHDAWGRAGGNPALRDLVTYILQEDDSYRFRFQWMVPYMYPKLMFFLDPVMLLKKGLEWMEQAEVIGDMKERVRLVRRVILTLLEEKENREFWVRFCHTADWSKIRLSKADKYFFRGKYFKVDLDAFEY